MTSGGSPVQLEEVRLYRMRSLPGDTKKFSSHWKTTTTDFNGQAVFTIPDPNRYSQTVGYEGAGVSWYIPNLEGSTVVSHTHSDLWCPNGDCPPNAGGVTNPHFYEPSVGWPPAEQSDTFAMMGMARLTVSVNPTYNSQQMRLYRVSNTGDSHWKSATISQGQAVFTAMDYTYYSTATGQTGTGFKFYLTPTGQFSPEYSGMGFGFPPVESSYSF